MSRKRILSIIFSLTISAVMLSGCSIDSMKLTSDKSSENVKSTEAEKKTEVPKVEVPKKSEPQKKEATKETTNETKPVVQDTKKAEPVVQEAKKVEPVQKAPAIKSRKQEFKDRLDALDKKLKAELKNANSWSNAELNQFCGDSFKQWDKLLNEIYSVLKEQLSAEDMKKLTAEETKWIKQRDDTAEKDCEPMKGGSGEPSLRYSSLAKSTQDRCYVLVDKYLK